MKKKLLTIMLCCVLAFSLISCKSETVQINVSNNENLSSNHFGEFVPIGDNLRYDSATRIVYLENDNIYGSVLIPYYAPNGLPYRYNPEINAFEEITN